MFPLPLPNVAAQSVGPAPSPSVPVIASVIILGAGKVGGEHAASVSYTGYPRGTISYQWTRDGVNISGATAQTYTPEDADDETSLGVDVIVTNSAGSDTGSAVPVAITYPAPVAAGAIPDQNWTVGVAVSLDVSGDFTGDDITFSSSTLPSGLSISAAGLITGTPDTAAVTSVSIIGTNSGGSASSGFSATVEAGAGVDAPTINAFAYDGERFDDGYARGVEMADILISGGGVTGQTIEARAVSQGDYGNATTAWQTVGTVSESVWSGSIKAPAYWRAYKIEARHASTPAKTATTTNTFTVGTIATIFGQSEDAYSTEVYHSQVAAPALLTPLETVSLIGTHPRMVGRQSAKALKTLGVDALPTGATLVGISVSISGDDLLFEDWDFDGYTVLNSGNRNIFRNCAFGETAGDTGVFQYIGISASVVGCTIEHCAFTGFDGEGGPDGAIRQLLSGTGLASTTSTGIVIRHNHFKNMGADSLKLAGGARVYHNLFDTPVNLNGPSTLWDAGTTYNTGDYASNASGAVFKSKGDGNVGNAVPESKTDNAFWTNLDPHVDHITVYARIGGPVWITHNYFRNDLSAVNAIGMNNFIRIVPNGGSDVPFDEPVIVELNVSESADEWVSYPIHVTNSASVGNSGERDVFIRFNRLGSNKFGMYMYPTISNQSGYWTGNVDYDTGSAISPPISEFIAGAEVEFTRDDAVVMVHDVPSPKRLAVTNAAPRTASFAAMTNMFAAISPGRLWTVGWQAINGTSPEWFTDDSNPNAASRPWSGEVAFAAMLAPSGQPIGIGTWSWFAAPASAGFDYGERYFPVMTGKLLADGSDVTPGQAAPSGGFDFDHTIADLYDRDWMLWCVPAGSHRFDPVADQLDSTHNADGSIQWTMLNKERAGESWDEMLESPYAAPFFARARIQYLSYQTGNIESPGGWNGDPHPAGNTLDGLPLRSQLIALNMMLGAGFVRFDEPIIDASTWQADGSYMEMTSSVGPITTTRAARSEAAIGSTFPHWTDVFSVEIDGSPAHRAELENGAVRVYPLSGSFTDTSVITFGAGGGSGMIEVPEDFDSYAWKNYPIVDVGLPLIDGLPISTVPDPAVLASTVAGDVTTPTLVSSVPADDATGVALDVSPALTFSEAISFGTGSIILRDATAGTNLETFDVTTDVGAGAGKVSISGSVLTINPTADLTASNAYAIRIASTAIEDTAGNAFAGISDDTTLNFATAAAATKVKPVWVQEISITAPASAGVEATIASIVSDGSPLIIAIGSISGSSGADGYSSAATLGGVDIMPTRIGKAAWTNIPLEVFLIPAPAVGTLSLKMTYSVSVRKTLAGQVFKIENPNTGALTGDITEAAISNVKAPVSSISATNDDSVLMTFAARSAEQPYTVSSWTGGTQFPDSAGGEVIVAVASYDTTTLFCGSAPVDTGDAGPVIEWSKSSPTAVVEVELRSAP